MKHISILLVVFLASLSVSAQTSTPKIRQLEKQRSELHKQIEASETLLKSTDKNVKSQLSNLALLSGQIDERQRYVWKIENDMRAIQLDINRLTIELKALEKDLKDKQDKYAESMRYMYRNRSIQEKLMFIFSGEDLNQIYRRMRYVRQYASYQRLQGKQLTDKRELVNQQKEALLATRAEKGKLLELGRKERLLLQDKEKERKTILASLQKKQKEIKVELDKKRKSANKLNSQIDKLIEIEIQKARKRAEQEERRKAEAKRKAGKSSSSTSSSARVPKVDGTVGTYNIDLADRKLSGNFERNKGRLPVPITGPYVVVGHFGQYQVKGLKHVHLDNKGIDIKGKSGAYARSIFNGEVSAVFQHNGLTNVLVRHGSYISVYCNLSSVRVKTGSQIKTNDILGEVHTDTDGNTILHFQLRKETARLNPELWLHR